MRQRSCLKCFVEPAKTHKRVWCVNGPPRKGGFSVKTQRMREHLLWIVPGLAGLSLLLYFADANRPRLAEVFETGSSGAVSVLSNGDHAKFAFFADLNPARLSAVVPHLEVLFRTHSSAQEDEANADEDLLESESPLEEPASPDENEAESSSEEEFPLVGLYDAALRQSVESAWNDGLIKVAGAVELPVHFWEIPLLNKRLEAGPTVGNATATEWLRLLLLRSWEEASSQTLAEELLSFVVFDIENPGKDEVHHGLIQLDLEALDTLGDTLCPLEPAPWDVCRMWKLDREEVREQLADALDLLGESFQIQLHFYWKNRGALLYVANTREGLQNLMEGQSTLPFLASRSGPAGLARKMGPFRNDRFVAFARLAYLQNSTLACLDALANQRFRQQESELQLWLNSPTGEEWRRLLEENFAGLTAWSSETLLETEERRAGFLARLWFEHPDVLSTSEGGEEILTQKAQEHFDTWLSPWLGPATHLNASWPEKETALVEGSFESPPVQIKPTGAYSQQEKHKGDPL
jgi:hypothetical protein